jgi:hypothetical protein
MSRDRALVRAFGAALGAAGLAFACGETDSDSGLGSGGSSAGGAASGGVAGVAGVSAGGSAGDDTPDASPSLGGSAGSVSPGDAAPDTDGGAPKNVAWTRTVASPYLGGLVDIATKGPELVAMFREYGVIDVGTGPLNLPGFVHLVVRYDAATGNAISVTQLTPYSPGGRILTDGTGRVIRFQNNPTGFHVLQLDAQGQTEWEKNFPITSSVGYSTQLFDVGQDAQGNIHFLGSLASTTTIDIDGTVLDGNLFTGFVVKLSPSGQLIWTKGVSIPRAMAVDANGQIALLLRHKKSNKAYEAANADGPIPEAAACTFECMLLTTLDAEGKRSWAQLLSQTPYVDGVSGGVALDLGMANQHINVFHQEPTLQKPLVVDVYDSATGGKLWDRQLDFTATTTASSGAPHAVVRYTQPFDFGDGLLDLPPDFPVGLAVVHTGANGLHQWARSFAYGSQYDPVFTLMALPETTGPILAGQASTLNSVQIDGVEQTIPTEYTDLIVALKPVP